MSELSYKFAPLFLCSCLLVNLSISIAGTDESGTAQATWISAIGSDRTETLRQLLKEQRPEVLLPFSASNGKTALMVATKVGDKKLAQSLVSAGADVNARTITGGTAFMFAVLGDEIELARWLEGLGADVHVRGTNGWTAVTIASAKGYTDTLDWLLDIGADGRVPDVYRFTPLMRAVDNNHLATARLLIEKADANVNALDEYDNTPMHHAVSVSLETGETDMVELLLEAGADPLKKNREGISPLTLGEGTKSLESLLRASH